MTKEQLEHLMENRDRLGLAMLRHCIYLAKTLYGWTPDQMLPQGRDPVRCNGFLDHFVYVLLVSNERFKLSGGLVS